MNRFFLLITILILISSCATQNLSKIELKGEKSYAMNSDVWMEKVGELNGNQAEKTERPNYVFVESGDSIYSIASRYQMLVKQIADLNGFKWPYKLYVGQKVILQSSSLDSEAAESIEIIRSPINDEGDSDIIMPEEKKIVLDDHLSKDHVLEKKKTKTTGKNKVNIIKPVVKFAWPVNGKIIHKFGLIEGGIKNDGINIAANIGAPVKSTMGGQVIYSGNELARYGNLIIIKHDNGWFSAYAHLEKITKSKNDIVKTGEIIGLVGKTGTVPSPQLHFAIRDGKTPVNPLQYLPKKVNIE